MFYNIKPEEKMNSFTLDELPSIVFWNTKEHRERSMTKQPLEPSNKRALGLLLRRKLMKTSKYLLLVEIVNLYRGFTEFSSIVNTVWPGTHSTSNHAISR